MDTNSHGKLRKSFAVFVAASFLIAPVAMTGARFGAATASAQEYYPDDRYQGPPPDRYPDQGYPPPDRNQGYPDDRYGPPPPDDRYAGPASPGSGYADYRLSPQQLENLLAPVALYPDPLLAQILLAATFVDQVRDAAGWMHRYNDPYGVDSQPWDVSVKAVAHYPSVLFMLAERVDWTVALGQAYVEQPADVTAAIQHLRWMAHNAGNLVTNDYWEIVPTGGFIEILPIRPQYIYVPVYEPAVVFVSPFTFVFGPAFAIGPWLNCDWDWRGHRIYYHGWHGPRWVERSRQFVRINNVYVNDRFRTVRVNRDIVRRSVNVQNLNRFTSVHRDANFASVERRNTFLRERGNAVTSDSNRRGQDRSRAESLRGRQGTETFRGRQGANQPPTRDERAARLRQERPQSFQNGPGQTRDERLRSGPDDRAARLNQERQARAQENSRRNRDDRGAAIENRSQPRDGRTQTFDDRAQRLREENRKQFLENRPPQGLENRDPRSRGERPQALENRGRGGSENRSRFTTPPGREQPNIEQAPRGERRVDAGAARERGETGGSRAPQARGNADAQRTDRAERRNEHRI